MTKRSPKAYKNQEFLNSREARTLRILSEYLEPEKRLEENGVLHTVIFFGSARIKPDSGGETDRYYRQAEELAFKLAEWSRETECGGDSKR